MRSVSPSFALALALASLAPLSACNREAGDTPRPPDGPLAAHARKVAAASGVPGDLVLAIGAVEGGLRLPRFREVRAEEDVPVAGVMELRHGRFDSLARGAALVGRDPSALRADTDLGTEAGALVLRELHRAARHYELPS